MAHNITKRKRTRAQLGASSCTDFLKGREKRRRMKGLSEMSSSNILKPYSHVPQVRYLLELPNELIYLIMTYFNAKELMRLRCVCRIFLDTIDNNSSLWSRASYINMWPDSPSSTHLFQRGSLADNKECFIKLGLNYLYHFNLNPNADKGKKAIEANALRSSEYLQQFDKCIYPKKPLTWMLIRPPWSSMKKAIYNDLTKSHNDADALSYTLCKIESLNDEVHPNPTVRSMSSKDSLTMYIALIQQMSEDKEDKGSKLQWLRSLHECASSGNMDACFRLASYFMGNASQNLLPSCKATSFCTSLFQKSVNLRCRLEQYQTRRSKEMRSIIVDWLAEVSQSKELNQQMLHAAVNYIDRFLLSRPCERTKLQLLGITCLLLAVKTHSDSHVHALTIRESSWLTDQTYQYWDVVKMMGEVIGTLKGDLWHPTSWTYLDLLFSLFSEEDRFAQCLAHYLHEVSLQYTCFGSFRPSLLACATIMLVFIILNKPSLWPCEYVKYTGFEVRHLADCASLLHHKSFFSTKLKDDREGPLVGITEKYSLEDYLCVAKSITVPPPAELKSSILAADTTLCCISEEPLKFVVESSSLDESLNVSMVSTKTIDYDGDCEDCNDLGIDFSDDDDEGFSVNRSFLYRCEYSVDETQEDSGSQSDRDTI